MLPSRPRFRTQALLSMGLVACTPENEPGFSDGGRTSPGAPTSRVDSGAGSVDGGGNLDAGIDSGALPDAGIDGLAALQWWGLLEFGDESAPETYYYGLAFERVEENRYQGTSIIRSVAHPEYHGVFTSSARIENGSLLYEEVMSAGSFPAPGTPWCPGGGSLSLDDDVLGGSWTPVGPCDSTATFTDRSFPTTLVTLADVPDADLAIARTTCLAAGIAPETFAMEACLLDVGLTGNPAFAFSDAQLGETDGQLDLAADRNLEGTFAFGSGTPFEGSVETPCGTMTLESTHTQPFSATAFRNQLSGQPAEVVFRFARPIASFHLSLERVRGDEFLAEFSTPPTRVSGTLSRRADRVSTSLPIPIDSGEGVVSWENLNSDTLRFVIGGPVGTALSVNAYDLECGE